MILPSVYHKKIKKLPDSKEKHTQQNTSDINNTELDNPNEQLTMTPLIENAPNTISDIQLNTTEPLFLTIGENIATCCS
ncbi:hypothetical protein LSPH24S_10222 [Lysinibacillus sphaericus]